MSKVRRAPWIGVGVGVMSVGVIGLAQLTLPGIAAQRVRDQIGRYGAVRSAHVTASPAIELLWGDAQSVSVTAGSLRMSFAQAAELLSSDGGFDRLDMTASSLALGSLTIGQAGIHKHGDAASLEGNVEPSGLRSLLPQGVVVQLLGSAHGEVQIRLRGDLFGVPTAVAAVIGAEHGKLEVHSQAGALGPLTITLFSDPRFRIEGVEMSATRPGVYHVRMSGVLH